MWEAGGDPPTNEPFVQYDETDWEFMKRLLRHLKQPLQASVLSEKPNRVHLAMKKQSLISHWYRVRVFHNVYIKSNDTLQCFDIPLASMKGIDIITACRLIAEIGDATRFKNASALARFAGVAHSSSSSISVQYATNRANRTLSGIFYDLAMNLITPKGKNKMSLNLFFYEHYHRKLAEGKTKNRL